MLRRVFTIIGGTLLLAAPTLGQWQPSQERISIAPVLPQTESAPGRKSLILAITASVLLPGLGEWYAGNFEESGRFSVATEGALWVTYAALRMHGTWVRNDARAFGSQMAGISFSGKDEDFEVNIGNFLTVDDYNQTKLNNREFDKLYTGPAYAWSWSSDAGRQRFKDERIRSDRIFQSAKFVIAGLVVNRVVSAFAAGRGAAAANRAARRAEWGIGMNAGVDALGAPALTLSFRQRW